MTDIPDVRPPGEHTEDLTGEDLLRLFEESDLSQRKFARAIGMDFDALHGKIYRAQQARRKGVDDRVQGNYRTVRIKSSDIKSPEELIQVAGINLEEWTYKDARINTWQVGAKTAEKSIEWKDGIIVSGYVEDSGRITKENLYQVEVKLLRKNPVALEPILTPVQVELPELPIEPISRIWSGKTLMFSDPHFGFVRNLYTGQLDPFHDREALSLMIQLVATGEFDEVVIAGDLLDLAEWSDKFVRSPEMYWTTQPAIVEAAWFLAQLRKVSPRTRITVIEGNHDERLLRLMLAHMNQAYGLKPADQLNGHPVLSVPNLLGLERMGVGWIGGYPNGEHWIGNDCVIVHGHTVRSGPGATASAVVKDASVTTGFGHAHRIENVFMTSWDRHGPKIVSAFCPGCVCRIDGAVPGVKARTDWQQGFAIVQSVDEDAPRATTYPIFNGRAVYNDRLFTGTRLHPTPAREHRLELLGENHGTTQGRGRSAQVCHRRISRSADPLSFGRASG